MSYTLAADGNKQALLKDGVPVASLDPSAVNLPIVLDDSIAVEQFDALVNLWADFYHYEDYLEHLYQLDKSNSDDIDFPMFDGWEIPINKTSFVVMKMKEFLTNHTRKIDKTIKEKLITTII